jgi:anthranilate phosphoribosyltransferase
VDGLPAFADILTDLLRGTDMDTALACSVMETIMAGAFTPAQIAALAVALRAKGESEDEILGFARAMRTGAVHVPDPPDGVVDIVGTGGDRLHTFNISTAAALVAAACGVTVAKHGNRAASSKAGAADVLEALGVALEQSPEREAAALHTVGIAFLYARTHHPALKHAASARKELGIRTIFNLLGPMTNPADARVQLMGVFPGVDLVTVAGVLARLGIERAMVVRGKDGMDEITLTTATEICEVRNGTIESRVLEPQALGLERCRPDDLVGGDAEYNAAVVRSILDGEEGPRADIVALNAGAGIYLAGKADTHADGIVQARAAMQDGRARDVLARLVAFTQEQA